MGKYTRTIHFTYDKKSHETEKERETHTQKTQPFTRKFAKTLITITT